MQEAEVSLRVALYYIRNGLTDKDVVVSIDGAHIKTGENVHFDIWSFMSENCLAKCVGDADKWQGDYKIDGYKPHIIISSKPGEGDVVVFIISSMILMGTITKF